MNGSSGWTSRATPRPGPRALSGGQIAASRAGARPRHRSTVRCCSTNRLPRSMPRDGWSCVERFASASPRSRGVRLIVTHDPLEAASLADRVVVLEDGRVTQEGPFGDVSARPRSAWIARMAGLNLLRGAGIGRRDAARRRVLRSPSQPTCTAPRWRPSSPERWRSTVSHPTAARETSCAARSPGSTRKGIAGGSASKDRCR